MRARRRPPSAPPRPRASGSSRWDSRTASSRPWEWAAVAASTPATAPDAEQYVTYVRETGIVHYRSTPGNLGAWILQRSSGDRTEILTLSFWEDMDAVKAFAGDDPSQAVYYPADHRFLVDRSPTVEHYQVD